MLALLACASCEASSSRTPNPPSVQNPFAGASAVSGSDTRYVGRVLERLDAGSYVYLRVDKPGSGPSWVVTAEALAPDTEHVRVHVVKRVESFASRRLQRTFSPLGFAIVRKDRS